MNFSIGQKKQKDETAIEQAYQKLLDDYIASPHNKKLDIIDRAYHFAKNAHYGMQRISGEPYMMHPIEVARIACTEIGLGSTSICAALLHDVPLVTAYTIDDIRSQFGDKIADIVADLNKISGGIFGNKASDQTENISRLILTMSHDIRVILVKLADRVHNMRTLYLQPTEKQSKIAGETQFIYAPLAHRLGLFAIKNELENLCFKYEHPLEYQAIEQKLNNERNKRLDLYKDFAVPIKEKLNAAGLNYTMKERIKSPYSIWKKMQAKNVPIEEVYDILGARIVFTPQAGEDEKLDCWKIYNLVTSIYTPHPSRTRDWVSTPKATGYEALHVTLMGPEGLWIEIQIRSKRMDDIAEKGLAAHWNYKKDYTSSEAKVEEWLNTVNDLLKNPDSDAMKVFDTFKMNLYDSEIFVFTPKGDIKTMPKGATALDFAFLIHSDIGIHCIGAKVNNKIEPLNYALKSGDQIEILTAKNQTPKPNWMGMVETQRAKDAIENALKRASNSLLQNWLDNPSDTYTLPLQVRGIDRKKMLLDICTELSKKMKLNIKDLTVTTEGGTFKADMHLKISKDENATKLCNDLKKIEGVEHVVILTEK